MKLQKIAILTLATSLSLGAFETFNSLERVAASQTTNVIFKDIKSTNPNYHIIQEMQAKNIISGYPDGTFKPDVKITRQQAAALINRAANNGVITLDNTVKPRTFSDLNQSNPFYNDVMALYKAGLLMPDKNGKINPNKALTRGEMAVILVNAFDIQAKADYDLYDVTNSKYRDVVRALYSNGITVGYEDYTFKPNEGLSRVHYVVFMHRAMNLNSAYVPKPIPPKQVQQKPVQTKPSDEIIKIEDVPGATLIENKGFSLKYKYVVNLPSGGKITEVSVATTSTTGVHVSLAVGVDMNGASFLAKIYPGSDTITFQFSRPSLTDEDMIPLRETLKLFLDTHKLK